jgi:hypothetical protein
MADLKNFDEKGLLDAMIWAARRAQESVETTAQAILDDIRTVARAQAELPKRLDDLLARAVGFWVTEFSVEKNPSGDVHLTNIRADFGNYCVHLTDMNRYEREPRVLPVGKRYRCILIVQEVDDVRPT